MSVQVKVNGDAKKAVKNGINQCVLKTAVAVANHAKTLAPVDTGNLRGSIDYAMESNNTAIVGTNLEYAIYQEFGTRKMAAQPFLRPAAYVAGNPGTAKKVAESLNREMKGQTK